MRGSRHRPPEGRPAPGSATAPGRGGRPRDAIGVNGAEIFGRERMYQYLTPGATTADGPPEDWDPRAMPADGEPFAFPHRRVFCLVGTNPDDYDVARGLSSAVVGPRSDGLVQIDNAYVPGAFCAYVHRSHSGRYGLVNSEEGYQNLRRFLFGDLKVESALVHFRLPEEKNTAWQAEVGLSIRGLQTVMHERTGDQWCPIQLDGDTRTGAHGDGAVPLVSTFLCENLASPNGAGALRYALHLRILSLRERDNGFLDFRDHIEQTADFDDILVVDVSSEDGVPALRATWNSDIVGPISDYRPTGPVLADEDPASGRWISHIPLPGSTTTILGEDARIRLAATEWS
ncbi:MULTISPECIES: hypothetical protein [unclassified Streptomyces]|uniref:hypothetical protein n=1 Tax=unclassified Streptomyces TaxID=2593676 RepID=UPI0035E2F9A1